MLTRLKYFIVTLLAGGLLAACSSDEPATSSCEMKFDIYNISSRTSTDLSNIFNSPFAIFADRIYSQGVDNELTRVTIFENTPVTYTGSGWTTPSVQYWFKNYDHSFVAVHPSSAISDHQYSKSQLSFTYTLPENPREINDVLVATHRRLYTEGFNDVVFLRFAHLFSSINLAPAFSDNILGEDEYIEFRKIELTGFKTQAVFSVTPASLLSSAQTDDRFSDVNGHQGEGVLTIEFDKPRKVKNDKKNVNLFESNDAIIMLPQTFAPGSDAKITVYYTISDDPTIKQAVLSLDNQNWLSGKTYTYRFTIDRTGPHFETATISEWEVADVGNFDAH